MTNSSYKKSRKRKWADALTHSFGRATQQRIKRRLSKTAKTCLQREDYYENKCSMQEVSSQKGIN